MMNVRIIFHQYQNHKIQILLKGYEMYMMIRTFLDNCNRKEKDPQLTPLMENTTENRVIKNLILT